MKKLSLSFAMALFGCYSFAQTNSFPTSGGNVTINSTVPANHGNGYNALWLPNATALMPENDANWAGISLTANIVRTSTSNVWGFANPALPAWRFCISDGPNADALIVSRSSPSVYSEQSLFTINKDGDVGIGAVAPSGKLHVVAPLDNSLSSVVIGDASTGNLNVPVGAATGGYNIDFHGYRDVVPEQIGARIRAERINNYEANNALVQAMDLVFYTSNGGDQSQLTEKMRINYDGTVGINTANTHGYMFGVNGSAIATSMTVKLSSQWGDYIFDKAYQLPSLNEIKSYIDKNHHLMDMPSAQEIEEKGINLGDIVTTQTKKIEELTLYLIDKDKQLSEQQKQIEQQNTRLAALEAALKKLTTEK